ncbi:MAG: YvcK family protein [Bacilli bacterium]|nr:YvcK family protein [Bacilli bacterium]
MKKVLLFGGGSGLSSVMEGLKEFPLDITAVVSVADNGNSTGKLRKEFQIPAVGDIRKVLTHSSKLPNQIKNILEYRFQTESDLDGHAVGNLILTAFLKQTGSLQTAIDYMRELFQIKPRILPLSEDYLILQGETKEGIFIQGEEEIAKFHATQSLRYQKEPVVLIEIIEAILDTDFIIVSMGSLYTSILPNFISQEIQKALQRTNAKIIYLCNALTQKEETSDYRVSDHLNALQKYLKKKIDVVIASNTTIDKKILNKEKITAKLVEIDQENILKIGTLLIEEDLTIIDNHEVKYDSIKLSSCIFQYVILH